MGTSFSTHCGTHLITDYGKPVDGELDAITSEVLALDWITKKTARHEYFMSHQKRVYSYGDSPSGHEVYYSREFSTLVKGLMDHLNESLGAKFNACFLNRYDDEHQHLGWHADDFDGMDLEEPIAVVSLGETREIWVKPNAEPCPAPCLGGRMRYGMGDVGDCITCGGVGFITPKGEVPMDRRITLPPASVFIMPPTIRKRTRRGVS